MSLTKKIDGSWKNCPACKKYSFVPQGNSKYQCINDFCGYSEPPKICSDIDFSKIILSLRDQKIMENYFKSRIKYDLKQD